MAAARDMLWSNLYPEIAVRSPFSVDSSTGDFAMASLLLSSSVPSLPSPPILTMTRCPHQLVSTVHFISHRRPAAAGTRFLTVNFSLTDANTSSSLDEEDSLLPFLHELSACLDLPPDYLSKLPRDLRIDLNDAAFDLANGPVLDECGEEVGEFLLNLSRAWEQADTLTSNIIASKLPSLHDYLTSDVKPATGKRLLLAGKRFDAMGQYGQGELSRIAKAMIKTGKLLSKGSVLQTGERLERGIKSFKFGELQVALTPERAFIGAAIALAFGLLSWELSQGIQSIQESSFLSANDNALSLRGFLLVISYSSAILSAFASVGLLVLGWQLRSENKSNEP